MFKILTVVEMDTLEKVSPVLSDVHVLRHKRAEKIIHEARDIVQAALPQVNVHTELREGPARCQIVEAASLFMADMIVVGAHGRAPNRLIPGTIPNDLMNRTRCKIELVKLKPLSAIVA